MDPLLSLYVQSGRFRRYTAETRRNYATDMALLLTFLWNRGKAWTDALDRALCNRDDIKDTPSLDRCVPGCGNIARTDQQAAQLRARALTFENRAAHVPQPVGDRLRATAARLREQADKHDRTRITTERDAE